MKRTIIIVVTIKIWPIMYSIEYMYHSNPCGLG